MNILFVGDIVGRLGRETIKKLIPGLKESLGIDFVVANGENMAHGRGFTEDTIKEVLASGVDLLTGGDHSFDERSQIEKIYNGAYPIIRPANIAEDLPGDYCYILKKGKKKVLVINIIGRVFMKMDYDCPFRKIDKILANFAKQNFFAIIVDIHAEATSEKNAIFHHLDGRVSAVLGTHTHVMTADHYISDKKTAYITDVGMTGFAEGCIGIGKESVIDTFITQIKTSHYLPEKGKCSLSGVLLTIGDKSKEVESFRQINKKVKIY